MEPQNPHSRLSIDTIRTLAMDAVQAAASGHPGAPMGLAPVGYTLWRDVLRYDPDDPLWPNRDRFVLSAGHASMLLYALLHLAGVKADRPRTRRPRRLARRHQALPPARQPDARPSGIRLDLGRRDDDRPPRPGVRPTASAWPSPARWLAARYNRPGFELFNYRRLRPGRRRLHGGGPHQRGRLPRRPPEALQPVLDLRQQPHHHRRQNGARLQRGRRRPVRRLRLERASACGRQRPGPVGLGLRRVQGNRRPADADHRRQPHRLRRAAQAGLRIGPRRAAGRGRDPAGQEILRLARGRQFLVPPDAPWPISTPGSAARGRALQPAGVGPRNHYKRRSPTRPTSWNGCSDRPPSRRLGQGPARLSGRREGPGHASQLGDRPQRRRQKRPLAHGRLGRPGAVDENPPDLSRRGRLRGRRPTAAAISISASASTP